MRIFRIFLAVLLPLIVLLMAIGIFVWFKSTAPQPNKIAAQEKAWDVEVAQFAPIDSITQKLQFYGKTVAKSVVDIRPLVSGEVVWINPKIKEGAFVQVGDEILHVDTFNYDIALKDANLSIEEAETSLDEIDLNIQSEKTSLSSVKEQWSLAKKDYDRAKSLYDAKSVSDKFLDDKSLVLSQRESALDKVNNSLKVLDIKYSQQKSKLERLKLKASKAKRDVENTIIKSPIPGYVKSLNVEKGKNISTQDILLRISHMLQDVEFTIGEKYYLDNHRDIIGKKVKVISDNQKPVNFTIERISDEVDSGTASIKVYAVVEGGDLLRVADAMPLRSGVFVWVEMDGKTFKNVVKVPKKSIYRHSVDGVYKDFVYIIEDNRLKQVAVSVKSILKDGVLIDSKLLQGKQVLITKLAKASEGLLVKVVK